ncbi:DNA (cytosine-5-)-methyltransferase [Dapis sp. BLCC M126]|uniref:DNA (cytosine-5-)-methyltransferase n=1 Tax=Dapis sp. BLCC M126 TaxID=3400189 RepID=UPI003CF1574C
MSGHIINSPTQLSFFNLEKPINLQIYEHRFTFIDLFAGIGGFRIPLEELGGKCLGYSEIDSDAIKVYQQNFLNRYINNDEKYLGDITKISKLPWQVNLIVGGVPCQPWSVAGKLRGFDDSRGKLWFDTIRVVEENQPEAFIFENVRGLISPANQRSFELIIQKFKNICYRVYYKLLNSADFGLPQNRERVFIVGIRKDLDIDNFCFPEPLNFQAKLFQVIDGLQDNFDIQKAKLSPDILFNGNVPVSRNRFQKNDELNDFFVFCDTRNGHTTIHSWDLIKTTKREKLICETILKNRRRKKYGTKDGNPLSFADLSELIDNLQIQELNNLVEKKIIRYVGEQGYEFVNSKNSSGINGIYRIFLPHSEIVPTLTATGTKDCIATVSINGETPEEYKSLFIKEIYRKKKYRYITAKDCGKLQGFPTCFRAHSRENIAKKQFGNAVSIPVVYYLAKSLVRSLGFAD